MERLSPDNSVAAQKPALKISGVKNLCEPEGRMRHEIYSVLTATSMKALLTWAFSAWALLLSTDRAVAQHLPVPAVPVTVEARVRDVEGLPVEGATVHLSLPRYRLGDKSEQSTAKTDQMGVATLSGTAQHDYSVSVEKAGYYHTQGTRRMIDSETGLQRYATGVQKIDLELRPIINPISGVSKTIDRLQIPVFDKPLGFDLEVGDWVSPHGRGKNSDFVFTVGGYFKSLNDFDQSLTLTFSNLGDGLTSVKIPPRVGSIFKFPYEAPLSGYAAQRTWRRTFDGKTRATSFDNSGETNYIFRVRTELDEHGGLRRALHGVVFNEIVIGGNNEVGRSVTFTYAMNPSWTRNIEFDPAKTASSPR